MYIEEEKPFSYREEFKKMVIMISVMICIITLYLLIN
jgi:hypothetical protein